MKRMFGFQRSPIIMEDVSRTFRLGYLFDSVYSTVEKAEKSNSLNGEDKKVLKDAVKFLKNVQKGESDVKNGVLGGSALESIGAYKQSLKVFLIDTKRSARKFDEYIQNLITLTDKLDEVGRLEGSEINQLKEFFESLNIESYKESERSLEYLHQRRGPTEWIPVY